MPDGQPPENVLTAAILAGGDGTENVRQSPEERADALTAAEDRFRALTTAARTASQRVEHARSAAGNDIATHLAPSLATHRERFHAAVTERYALCVDSIDLSAYVEEQG
ncbi:MAG TPA: hypothetical protein VFN13_03700 [Rudaea sp.]|nr:hypothetical protein [Rudaea sp.]